MIMRQKGIIATNRAGVRNLRYMLLLGAVTLTSASEAWAQSAPAADPATGEIIVTANRRGDQNVIDVPLAIDAYSGSTLTQYNVSSVQDLTKINPSLNVVNLGASQQQIVVRGISSNVGATTGVYLDEAPLIGPFNANVAGDGTPSLRLQDIDHIEVLKGPQGTLFGAGSMSGTLRVVVKKPDLNDVGGAADGTWSATDGGNPLFRGSAALNLPVVSDRLGIRLVGWTEQGGGYIDKQFATGVVDKNANDIDLYGGRVILRWRPVDDLTIDLAANYQRTKVNGPQYVTPSVGFQATPPNQGRYANFDPVAERYQETYQLYSVVADYDVGVGNIIATGSYGRKKLLDVIDTSGQACFFGLCAGTFAYPAAFTSDINYRDYTGELRFSSRFSGPFQIVAGAYYQNERRSFSGAAIVTDLDTGRIPCDTWLACSSAGLMQPGFGNNPVIFANSDQFNVSQYALYGQVDYEILPNLTATVGARYFHAKISDQLTDQQAVYPDFIFGDITTPIVGDKVSTTQSRTTWNFSLLWKPKEDFSIYARAASGFRIGGVNNSASIAAQAGVPIPASFTPDQLWNYEIGTKFFLFDRKLSFDISAYHIDWKDQQLSGLAQGVFYYQLNAGLTKTNGFEISTTMRPIEGLTLGGSVTYVDSKLKSDLPADVVAGGTPGKSGDRVPYVARWSFSGRAEYETPLSATVNGYLQTDFNYRSSSFTQFRPVTAEDQANGIPDNYITPIPSYFLWNARVGVRVDKVDIGLFVQNITNKYAVMGAKADANEVRYFTARPRSIGLSASVQF